MINLCFFYIFYCVLQLKKMSFSILPECVFNRFDNCLDELKANNLNSVCLVRCVRYVGCKTKNHDRLNICSCFKCKLAWLLLSVLDSIEHLQLLHFFKTENSKVPVTRSYEIFKWCIIFLRGIKIKSWLEKNVLFLLIVRKK